MADERSLTRRRVLVSATALASAALAANFPGRPTSRASAASALSFSFTPAVPDAVRAVALAAAAAWEPYLSTAVPIRIAFDWSGSMSTSDVAYVDGFANQPRPGTMYPKALANRFAGHELDPAKPDLALNLTASNAEVPGERYPARFPWHIGTSLPERSDARDLFTTVLAAIRLALVGTTGLVSHTAPGSGRVTSRSFDGPPRLTDTLVADGDGVPLIERGEGGTNVLLLSRGGLFWDAPSSDGLPGGHRVPIAFTSRHLVPNPWLCDLDTAMFSTGDGEPSRVWHRTPPPFDVALVRDAGWAVPLPASAAVAAGRPRQRTALRADGPVGLGGRGERCASTEVLAGTLAVDELRWALRSGARVSTRPLTFDIAFANNTPASAQVAIRAGIERWGAHLTSDIPVRVEVTWGAVPVGAAANTVAFSFASNPPPGLPDGIAFPSALAERLLGRKLGSSVAMRLEFGSEIDWYEGLDGEGSFWQSDLATVAAHEAGHGLGFSTRMIRDGSTGAGLLLPPTHGPFDQFLRTAEGQALTGLANRSASLGAAIASAPNFHGPRAMAQNGGQPVRVLLGRGAHRMPSSKAAQCGTLPIAVMEPGSAIFTGREREIDAITAAMMEDIGWGPEGLSPLAGPLSQQGAIPGLSRDDG